jgi:predicted AlkP superfamily phosphohydrolase/phosphomutase
MDMFSCLVEGTDRIHLYDIYVYIDEFDNLTIYHMAKKNDTNKYFQNKIEFFYLITLEI